MGFLGGYRIGISDVRFLDYYRDTHTACKGRGGEIIV